MEAFSHKKLIVYKRSLLLVKAVYELIDKFPSKENFALSDQLRRAVVSVPSNIAEGMGRFSTKEKIHFIEISYASLMETDCQLEIAQILGYITLEEYQPLLNEIQEISKMLSGLKNSVV